MKDVSYTNSVIFQHMTDMKIMESVSGKDALSINYNFFNVWLK